MGAPNAFAAPTQSIQDGLIVGKPPRWFLDGLAAVCIGLPVGTLVTNGKFSSILLRKQFGQNVPKIPCWTTQWVLNQVVSAPSVAMLADPDNQSR